MPIGQIEHANLTVTDPERSAALFERLLGWRERWRGPSQLGGRTIHVGSDTTYLALYTKDGVPKDRGAGYSKGVPLNHVGFLVDDLGAAEQVVKMPGSSPGGTTITSPADGSISSTGTESNSRW
jgi:catechol 2,3-dioxygenase-like lactoylglutathione lyase family enzyme